MREALLIEHDPGVYISFENHFCPKRFCLFSCVSQKPSFSFFFPISFLFPLFLYLFLSLFFLFPSSLSLFPLSLPFSFFLLRLVIIIFPKPLKSSYRKIYTPDKIRMQMRNRLLARLAAYHQGQKRLTDAVPSNRYY